MTKQMTVARRSVLLGGAAAAGLLMAPSLIRAQHPGGRPVADTTAGQVRGYMNGNVAVFKGIPYGADTGGENRFMPPQPVGAWTDIREAVRFGTRFPQGGYDPFPQEEVVDLDWGPMGEDSLVLNVWTPGLADGGNRPVMFWLHGGGFAAGSGGSVRYDGSNLAAKQDVVVVTVNHRLNAFGFLNLAEIGGEKYAASGNAGMLDIVQALTWVRDNIANFGGDPGNVTIFGQSGGAGKVSTLLAMPSAKGLFHRAIAQSGSRIRHTPMAAATDTAKALLEKLGITADNLDRLHTLPWEDILAAAQGNFSPVLDGTIQDRHPFDPDAPAISADVPLMTGWTLTERTFFEGPLDPIDDASLRAKVIEFTKASEAAADSLIAAYKGGWPEAENNRLYQIIQADWSNGDNAITLAERKAALGAAPAYLYHFRKTTPVRGGGMGSPHTIEIAYAFDNLALSTAMVGLDHADDQPLADAVSAAWAAFARTGDPNTGALPQWQPFTPEERAVLIIDDRSELVADPHREERLARTAIRQQA